MRWINSALIAAASLAVAACNDGGSGPDGRAQVSLSLTTEAAPAPGLSLDETVTLGENTIVIASAQLVLREIEFERAESSSDCADDLPDGDDVTIWLREGFGAEPGDRVIDLRSGPPVAA